MGKNGRQSGEFGMLQGNVDTDSQVLKARADKKNPDANSGLGIAKVVEVNYEDFEITLKVLRGTRESTNRASVPLVFPGAGARHIFGAMPMIGDMCIVGWMPQESGGKTVKEIPVILGWLIPGTWAGREWLTTSEFSPDEYDLAAPKNREVLRGSLDRLRHKLRHMQPGNIVASSAQGADIILDEGVTIANRRGNEIRLRDQDQALVVRTLQQFHAMAGSRIYSGMVQRDATFLHPSVVSDGKDWDGDKQSADRVPTSEHDLPDSAFDRGFFTPAGPLGRTKLADGTLGPATADPASNMDPFQFLQRGGFLNTAGHVTDGKHSSDGLYGGKPVFRVAAKTGDNAAIDASVPTLTEWRLEMAHHSDGRLPVTEQTDMFDAERLPTSTDQAGQSPNSAFLEVVYGSVVGNDPFSKAGRLQYGVPLVAKVFDGDVPNPRLEPVVLVRPGLDATPVEEHAATLFRLSPRIEKSKGGEPDTFWSVNKAGQLRASIAGDPKGNSIEAALAGGLKLSVGGELSLLLNGPISLRTQGGSQKDNVGLDLGSQTGAVRIYGGGSVQGQDGMASRLAGQTGDDPAVHVQAETNLLLEANRAVQVRGSLVDVTAPAVQITGQQNIAITTAERLSTSAKLVTQTYSGKHVETYSGPLEGLPTNGALHEVTYSPLITGKLSLRTSFEGGSREESFKTGSHSSVFQAGDASWEAKVGKVQLLAGSNSLEVNSSAIEAIAKTGPLTLSAKAGSATFEGSSSVRIETKGQATIQATGGISLATVVDNNQGAVLCSGSLEPLSGKPFLTWGLGAKRVTIDPAV